MGISQYNPSLIQPVNGKGALLYLFSVYKTKLKTSNLRKSKLVGKEKYTREIFSFPAFCFGMAPVAEVGRESLSSLHSLALKILEVIKT